MTIPIINLEHLRERISTGLRMSDHAAMDIRARCDEWAAAHGGRKPTVFISKAFGVVRVGTLTADEFTLFVGRPPWRDDMHRVNCEDAGMVGHAMCGWCTECERSRFDCGHLALEVAAL